MRIEVVSKILFIRKKEPSSLLACLDQKSEAGWLLPLGLNLPLYISTAQTLPQLEFSPVKDKLSEKVQVPS